MKENSKPAHLIFSDFIYVLFCWKNFLIVTLAVVLIVSGIVAFSLPKKYKATATVIIAPDNSGGGLAGLAGLLGGASGILSFNTKALGGGGILQEDLILGIMNSRTTLVGALREFNLFKYYRLNEKKVDLALKRFRKDISFDPNEFGLIEVSVIHKNPNTAAGIVNRLVHIADSLNIELSINRARSHRMYIETRYLKNLADIKAAEEAMAAFQERYGVFSVPEQVKMAIGAVGKLETELFENQVMLHTIENQFGAQAATYKNIEVKINALKDKLSQLNHDATKNRESLFIPFENMPEMQKQFIRYYRESEIQNKLLEFIFPMYEQAKMEEHKSIPNIFVIDEAVPPQLKYSPKRIPLMIGVTLMAFFVLVLVVLRGHALFQKAELNNPVEAWEKRILFRLVRFYKMNPQTLVIFKK
jgi:tyrosine-protein kinase Etk/Wzc